MGGCAGAASTLAPRGHGADRIAALAWVLFGVGAVVYVAVVVALAVAAFRTRTDAGAVAPGSPAERAEARSDRLILAAGAGVTSLVVGALILLTLLTVTSCPSCSAPGTCRSRG